MKKYLLIILLILATFVALFEIRDEKIKPFVILNIVLYLTVQVSVALISWALLHEIKYLILIIHLGFVGGMTALNIKQIIPTIRAQKAKMASAGLSPVNVVPADVLSLINFIVILATMAGIL